MAGETCEKCGKVHLTPHGKPACPAHIASGDRKGQACSNGLGFQTDHPGIGQCRKHGGNTSSANKNALAKQVDAEVRTQLGLTEWEPIVDPFSALADHAGKGAAIEEILRLKVEELTSLKQYGGEMGDRISVIFEAWERSYARLSSNLQAMARLSLEDRIASVQAKIDEATAELVSTALASALNAVTLEPDAREAILRAFGQALRGDSVPALSA
jgi:hypothetical protein